MSTPTAEQVALQGLLLILAEVQNQVRASRDAEKGERVAKLFGSFEQIEQLVEGAHAAEMIQLARAAIATTSTSTRRTFFAIVTEQDLPKDRKPLFESEHPRGPLLMETYLDYHVDRAAVERRAREGSWSKYGWVRIATVTVDIPDPPAAIPAAAAAFHA